MPSRKKAICKTWKAQRRWLGSALAESTVNGPLPSEGHHLDIVSDPLLVCIEVVGTFNGM